VTSTSTLSQAALSLGRASGEVSSPGEGVLRLLFRRAEETRGNFACAVLPAIAPAPLSIEGRRIETHGVLLEVTEGGAEVSALGPSGAPEPIFVIESVHESDDGHLAIALKVAPDAPFFGLGEQTGPMNRRHRKVVNWNLDYAPHTPSTASFYSSFPFCLSRARDARDRSVWYGLFLDNPGRSAFALATEGPEQATLAVKTGDLDLYVLAGPTPAAVVRRWAALTGTMEMPPRWMFGYQQSRWSYTPADRVREIARGFREHRFPCDVIYLDIDYMDGFRSFTWNPETFPEPKKLIDELHAQGFKVIPILNSAVAVDPSFPIYAEGHAKGYFLERPDGTEYHDQMWPGLSAFPDFTRAEVRTWWGGLHAGILDLDVDGIWNDMNEPTVFGARPAATFPMDLVHRGEGLERPHEEVHNAYGMLMDQATREGLATLRPGKRLPLLTRSAYAGVQRDAFLWTGDNSAWWEHMRLCISQVCNLGLSGVPISGPDVGGFHDNCSGEMFLRWVQMGAFFPYLRAHTMRDTRHAEPWVFGPQVLDYARRFVELRYRLLPYIYSLAALAARHGDPIMRPLFYEFPDDPSSEVADDEFMLGPDFLIAPILAPGRFYRAVYLAEGEWYSYFGETLHEGAAVIVAETPLDHIPVYIRANAVIPMGEPMEYVGEKRDGAISWHLWPAVEGEGRGFLYEDDGLTDGAARASRGCSETRVHLIAKADSVVVRFEAREGDFDPGLREVEVVIHGRRRTPRACTHPMRSDGKHLRVSFTDDGQEREIRFDW
jgi:alpha-glucosidase